MLVERTKKKINEDGNIFENLLFAHSIALLDFCGFDEKARWNIGKCKKDSVSSGIWFVDKNEEEQERVLLTTIGTMKDRFGSGMIYY